MSFMMMFVVIVIVVVEVEIGNDEVVGVVPNHSIYVYRYVERMSTTTTTTTNANKKVEEEMREGDFVARLRFKCVCVFCVEYYYHCVTNFSMHGSFFCFRGTRRWTRFKKFFQP